MPDVFKSVVDFFTSKDVESSKNSEACDKIIDSLKAMEEGANKLITWSLTLVGGSLLAIISNSYLHPESRTLKMAYFLFLIGWGLIAKVIYHGNKITRINILLPIFRNKREELEDRFESCNAEFRSQLNYFNCALVIFGIWLVAYLLWWVFGVHPPITGKT